MSSLSNIARDRSRSRQQELLRRRQEFVDDLSLFAPRQSDPLETTETPAADLDLDLAGQIQQQFLPKSFQRFGTFEIGSAVLPTGTVCGDIIDVTPFGRRWLSVWLVDATGHGVAAAMLAAHLQPQLRRVAWDGKRHEPRSPGRSLALLNKLLLARQPSEPMFVAAVCVLVDLLSGRVSLARGGSPIPMRVRGGGAVEPVMCPGRLVGIEPGNGFETTVLDLDPDESLVFWSDGLERLIDCEQALGGPAAGQSLVNFGAIRRGHIPAALDQVRYRWWQGRKSGACEDDISIIALRRRV